MKIAIVGCGALGSFYGAKLCHAGLDVHFLLRSGYDEVRRHGVWIRSPEGDLIARPSCARTPGEIGVSDLVIVGLKTTANRHFDELLPPLVGPHTAVLTLQNGLGNEEALARLFPAEQILGGLCFVCLNRILPGVVQHMAHGLVLLGEFHRPPQTRTNALAGLFHRAGVKCHVTENLAQAHWEKLVWNIPFNGLGVGAVAGLEALLHPESAAWANPSRRGNCLPTDQLLGEPRWEMLVRELMAEVIDAANALGHPLTAAIAEKQIERTRTMGAYKASTLIDFEQGRELELESLFLEPLRQAKKAGVRVPRMEALCRVLEQIAAQRNSS